MGSRIRVMHRSAHFGSRIRVMHRSAHLGVVSESCTGAHTWGAGASAGVGAGPFALFLFRCMFWCGHSFCCISFHFVVVVVAAAAAAVGPSHHFYFMLFLSFLFLLLLLLLLLLPSSLSVIGLDWASTGPDPVPFAGEDPLRRGTGRRGPSRAGSGRAYPSHVFAAPTRSEPPNSDMARI